MAVEIGDQKYEHVLFSIITHADGVANGIVARV